MCYNVIIQPVFYKVVFEYIIKNALIDTSGNVVVRYTYDAWGNHTVRGNDGTEIAEATHIGNINPIRYRGYYFDTEIGFYYLQTRYYDPTTGRFINVDIVSNINIDIINGSNLYAYCYNNPIAYVDRFGKNPETNGKIIIFSLINKSGNVWSSGRYKCKQFFNIWEKILSMFEARAISWSFSLFVVSNKGITILNAGVDLFEGRIYNGDNEYIGAKLGSASLQLGFDFNNDSVFGIEAKATILTIGYYSQNVNIELLIGSVGITFKFENGALKIGFSYGIGAEITIKFW